MLDEVDEVEVVKDWVVEVDCVVEEVDKLVLVD